ncbi:MAG: FG-GAP repeat protein [Candidatus Krumholzibacteriota bacterium]|nr:FG-GAP repeat protein [Candidatus Krumholzibacteriota bacterium]
MAPPEGASADWWQSVKEDIRRSEYRISWQEPTLPSDLPAAFQAPNRAQNLRSYFTPAGVRVTPRRADAGSWQWGLELAAYGHPGRMREPAPAELVYDDNLMEYRRGDLVEWYLNDERGLEQGFTLTAPPGDDAPRGELRIAMRIVGDLDGTPCDAGQAVEFTTADGIVALRYAELSARDATGRELSCRYELVGSTLTLLVDDRDARYPVVVDPLATSPAWTAESNSDYAAFGFSVASAGDVNGDGYSDIIVGAYLYDGGAVDAGLARFYRGSASGPVYLGWSQEGDNAGYELGHSVATAGDVNGDGYADVLVGVPGYDEDYANEGAVFLYYGSASGLSSTLSWYAKGDYSAIGLGKMVATAGDPNAVGRSAIMATTGATSGRVYLWYGSSSGMGDTGSPWNCTWLADIETNPVAIAAAGDVDGDGYGDILAASENFSNGETQEGGAFIWFGPIGGVGDDGTVDNADWRYESDVADRHFGASAATAGDVNGDGYADVVIGAPGYDGAGGDEGMALVFHGSPAGPSASPDWTVTGDQADMRLGCSVSTAGDIDGDGHADVVVGGAYFCEWDQTYSTEGWARVYFGGHGGLDASPGWSASGGQDHAAYGICVAAGGDVNGDGYADLLVGAPGYVAGQPREGRIFLYLGSPSGPAESTGWEQTGSGLLADEHYGHSVACAGDVDGDGYADVLVGAHHYTSGCGVDNGGVWLYCGTRTGLSDTPRWSAEGENSNDFLGYSVASAGDVNGDGYTDIIVGALGHDTGTYADAGRVYVYHGSDTGPGASPDWIATGDGNQVFLGCAVASAGDVNGDGYADVIVGARGWDDGLTNQGLVCVWHGSPMGLGPEGVVANADWTARGDAMQAALGAAVAAGDIDADGFSDVIAGAPEYSGGSSSEGLVCVWRGSSAGLGGAGTPASAHWTGEVNFADADFGSAVAAADFNGDGCADVAVGAPGYSVFDPYEGVVFMWYGGPYGLGADGTSTNSDWWSNGGFGGARLGSALDCAGDVNGDGYADLIAGAPHWTSWEAYQGLAYVYLGSATIPISTWFDWGHNADSNFGAAVAGAGDVNGDGYAEVIVGEEGYADVVVNQGRASVYYGNDGRGKSIHPRQRRADNSAHIDRLGLSDSETSFRIGATSRSPFGRERVKLEWEVKELGALLDGTGLERSADWTDTGTDGATISELVSGLVSGQVYHWRARFLYDPADSPFAQHSRWFTRPWNGWQEADLRMHPGSTPVAETTPAGFELHQNAPNPFNPATRIAFTIPDTGVDRIAATLCIHDVQGRLLRRLELRGLAPGRHEVVWDGRIENGEPAPSGVYCYRIEAAGFRSAKKMLLLK